MPESYKLNSYMALQMKEIKEHKYYLSEKARRDVGIEATMTDWVNSGHAERYHNTYEQHREVIHQVCQTECECVCGGIDECVLGNKRIHELLEDGEEE